MKIYCAWCKKEIGDKDGNGVSHGICKLCYIKEINKLDNELQEVANEKKKKKATEKAEADKIYLQRSLTLFNSKTVRVVE